MELTRAHNSPWFRLLSPERLRIPSHQQHRHRCGPLLASLYTEETDNKHRFKDRPPIAIMHRKDVFAHHKHSESFSPITEGKMASHRNAMAGRSETIRKSKLIFWLTGCRHSREQATDLTGVQNNACLHLQQDAHTRPHPHGECPFVLLCCKLSRNKISVKGIHRKIIV